MREVDLDFYKQQMSQWEVSVFDIIQSPAYRLWFNQSDEGINTGLADTILQDIDNLHLAFTRPPRSVMQKVLHSLGMDIEEPMERQVCRHKTFNGVVVYGERYVGIQRTDREWKSLIMKLTA